MPIRSRRQSARVHRLRSLPRQSRAVKRSHKRSHKRHAKRHSKRSHNVRRFSGVVPSSGTVEDELMYMLLKKEEEKMDAELLQNKITDILSDPANAGILKTIVSKVTSTEHTQSPHPAAPAAIALPSAASLASSAAALTSNLTSAMADPFSAVMKLFG